METYNGSVCPCNQTEKQYIRTDGQTVYLRDHMTRTPSIANSPIQKTPAGTPSLFPLHGILPGNGPTLRYRYIYVYVYGPVHLWRCHNHRDHCTSASISLPLLHQIFDASAIIGIHSSVLAAVSDWIRLIFSIWLDSIGFSWFDSTHV